MTTHFQLSRQDVEMLVGSNKAFAMKQLEITAKLIQSNAPLEAVGTEFDKAAEHLAAAEKWTAALIDMDRPSPNGTAIDKEESLGDEDE